MTAPKVVRVIPDVGGVTKRFDYLVPSAFAATEQLVVGSLVRVPLHGRRVVGWVATLDPVDGPAAAELKSVLAVVGVGPSEQMVSLCEWVAWRYAAKLPSILRLASPPRVVRRFPPQRRAHSLGLDAGRGGSSATGGSASQREDSSDSDIGTDLDKGTDIDNGDGARPIWTPSVIETSPTESAVELLVELGRAGQVIAAVPTRERAAWLRRRMAREGVWVCEPDDWSMAAAGASVVGGRSAVFAPNAGARPHAIVVVDEHDELHTNEGSPTWNGREVGAERARRSGARFVATSPTPSLEARRIAAVDRALPTARRAGWAPLVLVDRREHDIARDGLFSPRVVGEMRDTSRRVGLVLNRKGRARRLSCRSCRRTAVCDQCETAVTSDGSGFACPACGSTRPMVCVECGAHSFSVVRVGVDSAVVAAAALVSEPIGRSDDGADDGVGERVHLGTEALLRGRRRFDTVVFLDFDADLLSARYRGAEHTLHLLLAASRVVGGRQRGGRVMVQTRSPDHPVLAAALHADSDRWAQAELRRRSLVRMPPAAAIATIAGPACADFVDGLRAVVAQTRPTATSLTIDLSESGDRALVRADEVAELCDALQAVERPAGRLAVQVDPLRLEPLRPPKPPSS